MAHWRRFERSDVRGAVEFREIRREGIRCRLRWNVGKDTVHASTSTLDDEAHARRHEARKAVEWTGKGFVEVDPVPDDAPADANLPVLDVVKASFQQVSHPGFTPVRGFEETFRCELSPGHPLSHHHYFVLRAGGRSAISFNVRADTHDTEAVTAFLDFVTAHRDLPFDGSSHHKVPLPKPVGRFSHVLFCSPALGQSHSAYPTIAGHVASAFPVFDCEIGDTDTEVLVDARIHGHGSLPYTRWDRAPKPVVDLRFDLRPAFHRRVQKFLVFQPANLEDLLGALPAANPDSWLEVRTFRGEIARFTPQNAPTFVDAMAFLRAG